MFAALFNFEGQPVALPMLAESPGQDVEVKVLGASRQAALIVVRPRAADGADERTGIESLGNRYWMVGRIRLDARDELQVRLGPRVAGDGATLSDVRLCLHAYAAWGEDCVNFLAGDFAFVLWDDVRQALFGVRDQLGKRSLFQARLGSRGIVGDSLDWIAQQGASAGGLDDYWIADLLTLNCSREFERTIYRDASRLAPAHVLQWNAGGAAVRRYWRLDIAEPLQLASRGAYLEQFRELLSRAISDRLPSGKIGIAMSGGLDSTALAAGAVAQSGDPARVVAYCEHYEQMMHIGEDAFATLAARHLGIDLQIERFDDLAYDPQWQSRGIRPPEPNLTVINAHFMRRINDVLARRAAIWLEGEGPDNALRFDRNAYLSWLRERGSWCRLGKALLDYAAIKGVSGWADTARRHLHLGAVREFSDPPLLPPWLAPDLVSRLRLDERVRDLGEGGNTAHPWHPEAMASFTSPVWQDHFADYDLQESLSPLLWRHPFLDLRVLQFMLSVPPIPWAWKKRLMRDAMKGHLPEAVLRRPKTPLPVFPRAELLRRHGLPPLLSSERLQAYVDLNNLPGVRAAPADLLQSISVHVLGHWLQSTPASP
jgi:asparagine synthase (glutamine-hydrolysing)